jgi:Uma2 family endonuclease
MSAALVPPFETGTGMLPRKRFTRDEVERLSAEGYFEGQRYELIDGDLVDKTGQNPPHAMAIRRIPRALGRTVDPSLIQVQLPVEASAADRERSLPEPDVAILRSLNPDFDLRHPRGDELLLVIEVSDSTAAFDLSRKAALYATAGVPEYWVLDLGRRMLVVHRQPESALYRLVQLLTDRDTVSLENRPETFRVGDMLPGS